MVERLVHHRFSGRFFYSYVAHFLLVDLIDRRTVCFVMLQKIKNICKYLKLNNLIMLVVYLCGRESFRQLWKADESLFVYMEYSRVKRI